MAINTEKLMARIEAIAGAEKITKKELGALSRELVKYLTIESNIDIGMVNRLLDVLTPVNKRAAILFFDHFLPFKAERKDDGEFIRFGGREKGARTIQKYLDKAAEFLADRKNTIWTWQKHNIDVEKAPKYGERLTKLVERALKDEEYGLSREDIVKAVVEGGIPGELVIELLMNLAKEEEGEEAAQAA